MADNKVRFRIIAETDDATKELDDLDKKSKDTNDSMEKNTKKSYGGMAKAAVGYAAAGVAAFLVLGNVTTQHTNSLNAITNAYGENEEAARAYAGVVASSVGMTTDAFLTEAAAMSVTASNYGMTTDAANVYGLAVATVGGALGAVNVAGLSAEESTKALAAAMRGEAESAEALGLSLGDTAMKNYVMSVTGQDL
jgi:hypothetical protein